MDVDTTAPMANDTRFELKLVLPETQRPFMEHWLRLHPAACACAFPDRWVNNVYFDTRDYGSLRANSRGDNERSKVRYRWYGRGGRIDAGALEVKQKRDKLGWKLRFDVRAAPAENAASWRILRKILPLTWLSLADRDYQWVQYSGTKSQSWTTNMFVTYRKESSPS